ncbi:triose-phosphate isomerase [Buchnera aphidicola (Hormaphis cornu)]|nr:triose-phosphate isomerase [Buchnera aphidicola (Hormaphis cornu)]
MNQLFIIGNWKLNLNKFEIVDFLFKLNNFLFYEKFHSNLIIAVAPPIIYLETANNILKKLKSKIVLTAQNIDLNIEGPFTGETSIRMLKDFEFLKYVIVGHSERRLYHNETNDCVSKKFKLVKDFNLIPILCIGETKEEKELNQTEKVCISQIDSILKNLGHYAFRNTIIAYEPIWAIGSGVTADPMYVKYIHGFIRNYIKNYDVLASKNLIIQYGGSVTLNNAEKLLKMEEVNGVLIGSSSLKYDTFLNIVKLSTKILNE